MSPKRSGKSLFVRPLRLAIWTDASFELHGQRTDDLVPGCVAEIGAAVFDAARGEFILSSARFPACVLPELFGEKEIYIGPLEAIASAAADYTYTDVVSGRPAMYFIDNQ